MYSKKRIQLESSSFCITGKFDFGGRKKCIECVTANAGIYSNTLNKQTDYLIVGRYVANDLATNNSKKLDHAIKLQQKKGKVKIINEQQWLEAIYRQKGLATIKKWQPELF